MGRSLKKAYKAQGCESGRDKKDAGVNNHRDSQDRPTLPMTASMAAAVVVFGW